MTTPPPKHIPASRRKAAGQDARKDEESEALDEALEESFPASDPPSPARPESRKPDTD